MYRAGYEIYPGNRQVIWGVTLPVDGISITVIFMTVPPTEGPVWGETLTI